ncbi:MAG: hypothetical protein GY866_39445 [Proteobacteria bacterium]|nr:hypothetical protein [Pseudomonadota bacterium]
MIDDLQNANYGREYETKLVNPDFVALANACGISAVYVDSPEDLEQTLKRSLASKKMELIEVKTTFPDPPFMKY